MRTFNSAAPYVYHVPENLRSATLDDLDPTLRGAVQAIVDGTLRGLVLHGATGTGKTHAMSALLSAIRAKQRIREEGSFLAPVPPLWVDWPEFCLDFDAWKDTRDSDKARFDPVGYLARYRGPLLVDDVGAEHDRWGDYARNFDVLVNRRTAGFYPFAFTTNIAMDAEHFGKQFGARCYSRVMGYGVAVPVTGLDRRLV